MLLFLNCLQLGSQCFGTWCKVASIAFSLSFVKLLLFCPTAVQMYYCGNKTERYERWMFLDKSQLFSGSGGYELKLCMLHFSCKTSFYSGQRVVTIHAGWQWNGVIDVKQDRDTESVMFYIPSQKIKAWKDPTSEFKHWDIAFWCSCITTISSLLFGCLNNRLRTLKVQTLWL